MRMTWFLKGRDEIFKFDFDEKKIFFSSILKNLKMRGYSSARSSAIENERNAFQKIINNTRLSGLRDYGVCVVCKVNSFY